MKFEFNTTLATWTIINSVSSNYIPSAQPLLLEMFFELIIIVIIIVIIIIVPLTFLANWWEKFRGVRELPPSNFMDFNDDGEDPWTQFLRKIKELFGRK